MSKHDGLTPKQQRFVEEYLIDLNATQAAIRAGYSKRTAFQIGTENLKKPYVAAAIAKVMEQRSKELSIDAKWVLIELIDVYRASRDRRRSRVGNLKLAKSTLDSIGKHVDIKAFVERLEQEVGPGAKGLIERLWEARKEQQARGRRKK